MAVSQDIGDLVLSNEEILKYVLTKAAYNIGRNGLPTLSNHLALARAAAAEAGLTPGTFDRDCEACFQNGVVDRLVFLRSEQRYGNQVPGSD